MKLGSSFVVPADSACVFDRFLDPETMRSCIPGCEELVRTDESHYRGRLVNEIAHVRFSASFSAEITEMSPPHRVHAVLQGEDRRLASSIKLDATLTVAPDQDGSHEGASRVTYALDFALWGKLGRLGESIVRRRSAEVERQFVAAFAEACAGAGQPAAAPDPTAPPGGVRVWWRRLLARLAGRSPKARV